MTWSVNRFQFILLASVTLVIGHQSLPDAQFWKGKIKIVLPDTAYAAPLFWDHFPATMHAGGQTIRQPVDRICFDFSKAVPSVVQAEVLTLLSHVPDLETGGVCTGENDLSIAVATSDMLESEEIYLRCDAQRGHRVLHVLSGVGNGTVHPVGTALLRALSLLGFSFLHPLAPYVPPRVTMPLEDVSISEVPHLKIRGIHLHTMHPIELTDFLNGWGPLGIDDDAGFQKSFLEWHSFLVWMLANGLDRVQWALLWNEKWSDFAESQKRQSRLRQIVDVAHLFGVEVGIDAPVSLRQQNAFRLVRQSGTLDEELTQIQRRIDYLMGTGIDFLALESGTSEFTHSSPMRMLARLNYIAAYLDGAYDSTATIKVHVSSGQRVDGLVDPVDGGSLNINFLPWYADTRLGVMPHTVAYYGLGDIAPVYGNSNFDHIEGYLYQEVGQREVVWYPESAYWCSFDVDVPLFLPLYGERRLSDMRRLERARQSRSDGAGIDGQVIFSSGWEWGYWLGDVVAARAAWNPLMEIEDDDAAFVAMLEQVFSPFEESAFPIARLVAETAFMERAFLIDGENEAGKHSDDVAGSGMVDAALTGQAYLQGVEPLDEMAAILKDVPGVTLSPTQPGRISLLNGYDPSPLTLRRMRLVHQLLAKMTTSFESQLSRLENLEPVVRKGARPLYNELRDSLKITALRAGQMNVLFRHTLATLQKDTVRQSQLAKASESIMTQAMTVVRERELFYRMPLSSLASWRSNATAYGFGYLWTVHSLYYWKRDHFKITSENNNPCVANIYDPFELAFGTPASDSRTASLISMLNKVTRLDWNACLTIGPMPDW